MGYLDLYSQFEFRSGSRLRNGEVSVLQNGSVGWVCSCEHPSHRTQFIIWGLTFHGLIVNLYWKLEMVRIKPSLLPAESGTRFDRLGTHAANFLRGLIKFRATLSQQ